MRAWGLTTKTQLWQYDHIGRVYAIKSLGPEQLLVGGAVLFLNIGADFAPLTILNTKDGTAIRSVSDHTDITYHLIVTKEYVVSVGFEQVTVRDRDLQPIRSFASGEHLKVTMMEDDILASTHNGCELGLWNIKTGECISTTKLDCTSIAYYGEPGKLIICHLKQSLCYYDCKTHEIENITKANAIVLGLHVN